MIDKRTVLIFGYKLNRGAADELQEINEDKYFSLIDDDMLHELSTYETSDVILGIPVMDFNTDESFAYTINDINYQLSLITEKKKEELCKLAAFFQKNDLMDKTALPQIYFINRLY